MKKNKIVDSAILGEGAFYERPFPRKFSNKKNLEISAIFTCWLSGFDDDYSTRVLTALHNDFFQEKPYNYIMSRDWEQYQDNFNTLYRLITYNDFYNLCSRLYSIYISAGDFENALMKKIGKQKSKFIYQAINDLLGGGTMFDVNHTSMSYRTNLLLLYLARVSSPFYIWHNIKQSKLLVPCNDNLIRVCLDCQIITYSGYNIETIQEITKYAKTIFYDDPTRLFFALNYKDRL